MTFNSQESSQTQVNVILPRSSSPTLCAFDQTKLLDPAMKLLDLPTVTGIFDAFQITHFNLIGRPVLRVAICVNQAKHFDLTEAFEPDNCARLVNLKLGHGFQTFAFRIDLSVSFESGQKMPTQAAIQFQIIKCRIPRIETHHLW